jgi:pyruvate-formate lyase-activating enzyme
VGQASIALSFLDDAPNVGLAVGSQPDVEIAVRVEVVMSMRDEQNSPELADRVIHEVQAAQLTLTGLVVSGDVPTMQRMFVPQMRDGLRDCHVQAPSTG